MTAAQLGPLLREFLGPAVDFEVVSDGRWYWDLAVARSFAKGRAVFLCGDSASSWPPFGALGGTLAYHDAANLAWKMHAVVRGWAPASLLDSYQEERRSVCLRVAALVAAVAPDPGSLRLLGRFMHAGPLMRAIGRARWIYRNSGEHDGNAFCTSGLTSGQRYDYSPIVVADSALAPPDDPMCSYVPKVVAGGRVLHVRLADGSSLLDRVARDGYTLLVSGPDAPSDVVDQLALHFALLGMPLSIVDARPLLDAAAPGIRNMFCAALWRSARAALCRPDLHVAWTLQPARALSPDEAAVVARALCGLCDAGANALHQRSQCVTRWRTWMMVQKCLPMRRRWPQGEFVVDTQRREEFEDDQGREQQRGPTASRVASDVVASASLLAVPLDHHRDGPSRDTSDASLPTVPFYHDRDGDSLDSFDEFIKSKR